MTVVAVVSYRLGFTDGVSVEAEKWIGALRSLGVEVYTVAGAGEADVVHPGLAFDAPADVDPPPLDVLRSTFASADVVVAENICSLPMNPRAGAAVADALRGRPAVMRHHDVPWQRERFASWSDPLPTDPGWRHVCINALTQEQLRGRGIDASLVYNHFDMSPGGDGAAARAALGEDGLLALQPTRAIARKNIETSVEIAHRVGAVFWMAGPPEEDYAPTLDALLDARRVRSIRGLPEGVSIHDAYEACDLVTFPSTWEGFGNPTIESAIHRKPLVVTDYPVLRELRAFGFRWYDIDDVELDDTAALDHNYALAERHFNLRDLPALIAPIVLGD